MPTRPKIAEPMKRSIRQRSGFGCVICGIPIYQYHHIHGFDAAIGHEEEEITLLCNACHSKHHKGLISKKQVVSANASPHNIRVGISASDRVWYCEERICTAMIGSNEILGVTDSVVVLLIDFVEILRLSRVDGVWLLSLLVFNHNDELLLQIVDNELSYKADAFDIQFEGFNINPTLCSAAHSFSVFV